MYTKIEKCRICGNVNLEQVLNLGEQALTGVFPREKSNQVTSGPLRLVKCIGENDDECGLLQLEHSYELSEMYGENYGYRSGLNDSMVKHLHKKVERILASVELNDGDLVVDIGSNDSTTLQAYPSSGPNLVGIDPTGIKFHKYYPDHIQLIPDFFSSRLLNNRFPGKKAKIITSFSMFYDLEKPMKFMQEVFDVLADDGVWVFEQSYMPTMLEMNSYDTVCHEHLEYYALSQIKWMSDRVGFSIVDVEFNQINGGSFSVTVKKAGPTTNHSSIVKEILNNEEDLKLASLEPYLEFAKRVKKTKIDLLSFIEKAKLDGKTIGALGASTKGNVLLQYCGMKETDISFVGEVNPEKYECFTPGTLIPIIPEDELLTKAPDFLLVLPWHFKDFFVNSPKFDNSKLLFPLPEVSTGE